ncbi:MAG: BMP family protein [Anaerolineaceae bacterium]|nr:BMP family protein [Anaerolineaceae bacterium]
MKRVLFQMGLVLMLAFLVISGCAPAATAVPEAAPATEKTVIVEVEKVITATPAPVEEKPFRIALVLPSTTKDASFSQSMYESLMKLQGEMGADKLEIAYSESLFKLPDAAAAIRDYASQGYNLILAHGSQYGSSLREIAPDFPTTAFAWGTTVNTFQSEGINNIFAYTANAEQGAYVVGYISAMLSKTKKVGFCGPVEAGDGRSYFIGMKQGVHDADLGVTVTPIWTGSYSDVTAMATCAQTHIQDGADILSGSSQSVTGAIAAAKENHIYWFGQQYDMIPLAPEEVIASQIYDFNLTLKDMIAAINAGVYGGKVYTLTFKNGGLELRYNKDIKLPAEVMEKSDALIEQIKAGEIQIPLN